MKIDLIGNIYIQESLNKLELDYLTSFCSSVHYINKNSEALGLYDTSINKDNLLIKNFIFDEQLNLERSILHNPEESSQLELFPFYKPNITFTEKSIKLSFIDIKNKEDFLYFIEYLSHNILFFYNHFFSNNAYCKIFDKEFFDFFNQHSLHGHVYFKLSNYGLIFRLSCIDGQITLQQGYYPTIIKGSTYQIHENNIHNGINIQKQLESVYNKLSIIEIKNNALFEEEGILFSFNSSDTFNKLLQFYKLNHKLEHKTKDKIHKI